MLFVEFDGEIVEFNNFLCQIDIVDFVMHDTLLIPKTNDGFDDLPIVFCDFDNDFPAKNFDDLTSSSQVPNVETKTLSNHLRYVYIGYVNTLLDIISRELTPEQETSLVKTLRVHKLAHGCTLYDIKGINLALSMDRIVLEDRARPFRDSWRCLNPAMKEVVLKEILQLLDVVIIDPILDSKWVSPIHPKNRHDCSLEWQGRVWVVVSAERIANV